MIEVTSNEILITKDELFDPVAIFNCGQVFRYLQNNSYFTAYSGQKTADIVDKGDYYSIITDDADYFYNYFDLGTDYKVIIERIHDKPFMKKSLEYGKGIRILKQDYFENIISFIISANNNVQRIRGIIKRITDAIGNKYAGFSGFPTPRAMADAGVDFYKKMGAGYRAEYIYSAALAIADGFDIEKIALLDTLCAKRELMKLKGVGSKVADCILLFSYSRKDVFPVDTWIKKVYNNLCDDNCTVEKMRKYLLDLYGDYAGYAQQYLFYAFRDKKIVPAT